MRKTPTTETGEKALRIDPYHRSEVDLAGCEAGRAREECCSGLSLMVGHY